MASPYKTADDFWNGIHQSRLRQAQVEDQRMKNSLNNQLMQEGILQAIKQAELAQAQANIQKTELANAAAARQQELSETIVPGTDQRLDLFTALQDVAKTQQDMKQNNQDMKAQKQSMTKEKRSMDDELAVDLKQYADANDWTSANKIYQQINPGAPALTADSKPMIDAMYNAASQTVANQTNTNQTSKVMKGSELGIEGESANDYFDVTMNPDGSIKDYQSLAKNTEGDSSEAELTESGIEIAANEFIMTGKMPSLGRGKEAAVSRARILNRAA